MGQLLLSLNPHPVHKGGWLNALDHQWPELNHKFLLWRREPMWNCWLRPDSFLAWLPFLFLFLSHLPSSTLWILRMEWRWPILVRKPIKASINISSLLTQKHSYRSFQAEAIRGQTSIRYGSEQFSWLLPSTSFHWHCPSLRISYMRSFSQDNSGFRY